MLFGHYDAAGTLSRERRKGEQSQRRDPHVAEIVARVRPLVDARAVGVNSRSADAALRS
jgi:hypothetical protein